MLDVAAAITTIGVLLCVAIGAVASASGVRPKPASTFTLSLTTSSCARRRVVSAVPPSSFRMTSMPRPATLLPFCASHSFTAASIWRPVEAKGPVIGSIRPMRNGAAWARAPSGSPSAQAAASRCRTARRPAWNEFIVRVSPWSSNGGRS